jgi:hypothetical protein
LIENFELKSSLNDHNEKTFKTALRESASFKPKEGRSASGASDSFPTMK